MAWSVKFKAFSSHLLIAPPSQGKTYRCAQYLRLKDELFENGPHIKNVVFFYSIWQDEYDKLQSEGIVSKFINMCPTADQFSEIFSPFANEGQESIAVFDDFMNKMSDEITEIITVRARHLKVNTFLLIQSLFQPGNKSMRQISLNVAYLHLFQNSRDMLQFNYLFKQLLPQSSAWLKEAFYELMKIPYACLTIDLTPNCPSFLRYRTNILPSEFPIKIFVEKGKAPLI